MSIVVNGVWQFVRMSFGVFTILLLTLLFVHFQMSRALRFDRKWKARYKNDLLLLLLLYNTFNIFFGSSQAVPQTLLITTS